MSGFNDFMDKAGAFASKAAGKAKDLASVAAAKTKQMSRIAKLNMDISGEKDAIKKAYAELGQLYYEAHHDAPEADMIPACGQIDQAKENIAAMEAEIARLKEDMGEDADFETVVDQTAAEAAADEEPDVIVQIVEEEAHQPETPAEPEGPAGPEEDKPAE